MRHVTHPCQAPSTADTSPSPSRLRLTAGRSSAVQPLRYLRNAQLIRYADTRRVKRKRFRVAGKHGHRRTLLSRVQHARIMSLPATSAWGTTGAARHPMQCVWRRVTLGSAGGCTALMKAMSNSSACPPCSAAGARGRATHHVGDALHANKHRVTYSALDVEVGARAPLDGARRRARSQSQGACLRFYIGRRRRQTVTGPGLRRWRPLAYHGELHSL